MLQAWRRAKVMTWAGYILGFPTDTPESIARDIETIKRELPIEYSEFFFLTPLPGSEDHKTLYLKGARMDPDMNNYRRASDLPGFVVLLSTGEGGQMQPIAARQWSGGPAAQQVSRRQAELHRRPGALHSESAGRQRQTAAPVRGCHQQTEPGRVHRPAPTRKSKPASRSTRWRSACRAASPA